MSNKVNAISVNGLTKQYDDFILKDISFELPKGSIMGFIGENGAGKTTTIRAMIGAIKHGGEILLLGEDILKNPAVKEDIAVVFDELCFSAALSPKDISAILAGCHPKFDKILFFDFLRRFRLPEKKTIKDFSKGMCMKLSIAAALSRHPKLLILDEATAGLDPVMREEILDLLLEFIQDEENSVFFSSHITSDLDKIADYVTFIHNGELIFSKTHLELSEELGQLSLPAGQMSQLESRFILRTRQNQFGCEALITNRAEFCKAHRDIQVNDITTEQIMLFYARGQAELDKTTAEIGR